MNKPFPKFATDEEAEEFVATADLSEYDFSGFRPYQFKFVDAAVHFDVHLSDQLIKSLRSRAAEQGLSDSEYVAELIRRDAAASQ